MKRLLCAAVLLLSVAACSPAGRETASAPEEPVPSVSADPVALAELALSRLPEPEGEAVVEHHAAVTVGEKVDRPSHLGSLTLWAACAGSGQITIAVLGATGGEFGTNEPSKIARRSLDCTADPTPKQVMFIGDWHHPSLVYQVTDEVSAVGRAGYAFRITSDARRALTYQQAFADASAPLGEGAFTAKGPIARYARQDAGPAPLSGAYTMKAACTGYGTLLVSVGGQEREVPCGYPPQAHEFDLDPFSGGSQELAVEYRSQAILEGNWAAVFLPR